MRIDRNILLAFGGACLLAAAFTTAKGYTYDRDDTPSLASGPHAELPYKELITPPREFVAFNEPSIVELPNGDLFAAWSRSVYPGYNPAIWGGQDVRRHE